MKKKQVISEDDPIFLLQGDEGEIYVIDDLAIIATLDAKVKELDGMDEDEIGRHLLAIVNPDKYIAPQL